MGSCVLKNISLIILALSALECSQPEVYKNKNQSPIELIITEYDEIHHPILQLFNNTRDTIAIYAIGRIRNLSNQDTTLILNKIMYDIILEVEQNGKRLKSTEIDFEWVMMDNKIHEIILLYPDSTNFVSISYNSNFRDDFRLSNEPFKIRAIFEPPIEFLSEDSFAMSILNKNKNTVLMKRSVITSFVEIQ